MVKRFFIIAMVLLFANSCFAATAGNTSDPKTPYGSGIANMESTGLGPFKVSFDADCIIDKDLEGKTGISDAEIEGEWYLFRIGYTFADRVEPYVKLGGSHLRASWKQDPTQLKVEGETAFAVGVGGKVLIYEIPEYRLRLSLDGQYLYTDPDVDKATVDMPDRVITATEFKVKEWQITGIVSIEFPLNYDQRDPTAVYSLIPYVGFAYFDSDTKAKFTYSETGTTYELGQAENDDKLLFITGCDVTSPNNVSFNVEGRLVGETAVSGGLTVRF